MSQLLSVACLSLAAKMEENEVPLSLDLQASVLVQSCSCILMFFQCLINDETR